jgi:hypothetical protein
MSGEPRETMGIMKSMESTAEVLVVDRWKNGERRKEGLQSTVRRSFPTPTPKRRRDLFPSRSREIHLHDPPHPHN